MTVTAAEKRRTCFVISPIGDEGTESRRRADRVFKHIIEPVVEECGYKAVRADQISKPGIITSQVIQHLAEDPLVIADLAGHNPNVFYELAVRHVTRKPVIQITQVGQPIPFDVAPTRAIQLDHTDLESAAVCRQNLAKQIRSVEKDSSDFDNPISNAIDLKLLRQSSSPAEQANARIISMLSDLRAMIGEMKASNERVLQRGSQKSQKVEISLNERSFTGLVDEARNRGLSVQELVRQVVIPEYIDQVEASAIFEPDEPSQEEVDALQEEAEADARAEEDAMQQEAEEEARDATAGD